MNYITWKVSGVYLVHKSLRLLLESHLQRDDLNSELRDSFPVELRLQRYNVSQFTWKTPM